MSNSEHTKEPWEAVTDCKGECCWHIRPVSSEHAMDLVTYPEMSQANARRIVACVNACAGTDTEQLEIITDAGETFDFCYKRVKTQRDELLAAAQIARTTIQEDQDCLFECHKDPTTGQIAPGDLGLEAFNQYQLVIDQLDAAIAMPGELAQSVSVRVSDLSTLAGLICDRDYRNQPPTVENIDQCHALLIKMLGPHASLVYANDDGSEVPA